MGKAAQKRTFKILMQRSAAYEFRVEATSHEDACKTLQRDLRAGRARGVQFDKPTWGNPAAKGNAWLVKPMFAEPGSIGVQIMIWDGKKVIDSGLSPLFAREGDDPSDPLAVREEANALTECAFCNGYLKELHEGKRSGGAEQSGHSRITNAEMKKLAIEATAKLAELLALKEDDPDEYWRQMRHFSKRVRED